MTENSDRSRARRAAANARAFAELMRREQRAWERGDAFAVARALGVCNEFQQLMPEWLFEASLQICEDAIERERRDD